MGKIFCIMGKSSTGKDTIYKLLLKDASLNLKRIVPYTTRPIREGEKPGEEYFFTEEEEMQKMRRGKVIIEERSYDTFYGVWKYFTVDDGRINLAKQNYLMIGTPQSFLSVRDYYGSDKVLPVLIELDDGIRLERALNREKSQSEPKYEEMCRRFLADVKDFSTEQMEKCGVTQSFPNKDLKECISKITGYIQQNI